MNIQWPSKKVLLLIGVVKITCVVVFAMWVYGQMEEYCFFDPDIDTTYAAGFSEQSFAQVGLGMPATEVETKLGKPLYVTRHVAGQYTSSGGETWWYSGDGKCWWGDFAWNARAVVISDGAVVSMINQLFYD